MADFYLGSTSLNSLYLGTDKINDVVDYLTFMSASGGTITTDGSFRTHTFTTNDTFTVHREGQAEVFLVGGGGGGGGGTTIFSGGGGGAGGVVLVPGLYVESGSYSITVGDGGAPQTNGQSSLFADILIALGGGAGGGQSEGNAVPANNGGSGGGRNTFDNIIGSALQPTASGLAGDYGYGNDGVLGGGGASNTGSNDVSGYGGDGYLYRGTYYAGGGGAGTGRSFSQNGGQGGGGRGGAFFFSTAYYAQSGTANTGAGGGGGLANNVAPPVGVFLRAGEDGGSGIVIIRYQFQP